MDLSITGPKIYFSITLFKDVPFIGVIHVTQTMISSFVVMIALTAAAFAAAYIAFMRKEIRA